MGSAYQYTSQDLEKLYASNRKIDTWRANRTIIGKKTTEKELIEKRRERKKDAKIKRARRVCLRRCILNLKMDLSLILRYIEKKRKIIRLIITTTTKSLVRLRLLTKTVGFASYRLLSFLSVCVFFNLITYRRNAMHTRASLRR